ncbi:MAG: YHS domain-containing (seleno)protein [Pseudomonadota bacterium]
MRPHLIASSLILALSLGTAAMAADEYNVSTGLTAAGAPLGLHGVDPVMHLREELPRPGTAAHTAVHDGVAYYFDSAETKAAFEADPAAFLPQNGGFCTFGVSVGKKFDGDPDYAAVIDGKLYVFLNADIFAAFNKDREGTIAKAEKNWPEIRSVPATEL